LRRRDDHVLVLEPVNGDKDSPIEVDLGAEDVVDSQERWCQAGEEPCGFRITKQTDRVERRRFDKNRNSQERGNFMRSTGEKVKRNMCSSDAYDPEEGGRLRRRSRVSGEPLGLKRAISGLGRAIGGVAAFVAGEDEDEDAGRIAVDVLGRLMASPGGRPGGLLPEKGLPAVGLKRAVLDLERANGRLAAFAISENEEVRAIAYGVFGRLDSIVIALLVAALGDAGDAAARLRRYHALAKLALDAPEHALIASHLKPE
jgi:hypothetical protein